MDRTYSGCTPIHSRVTTGTAAGADAPEILGEFEGLEEFENEGRVPRTDLTDGEPTLSLAFSCN